MKTPYLLRLSLPLFAIVFSIGGQSFADIIPANRKIAWTPGTVTGVIGGIPIRTTIYKNLVTDLGADNTGANDCSAILSNAINACPANQVIYLPAGIYRINNSVVKQFQSNYTIRGAGQGLTILKAYTGGAEMFHFGTSDYPRPAASITITAGATKGSNIVTCKNTSTVMAGKVIRIEQTDLPWVKPLNGGAVNGANANMNALFKVVSKTPSTVTFWPPLPTDFTNSPKMASLPTLAAQNIGVEDLTIDLANSTAFAAAYLEMTYNCWFKNVEIKNAFSRQIFLLWSLNFEMRRCYIHSGRGTGPNHEGVDFYESGCWSLVEDNIFVSAGNPFVVLGDSQGGCAGNVIAYNYMQNSTPGNGIAGDAICSNHGPHNFMNLFEGNIAQAFESDGYKGSSSHNAIFRNWFSGKFDGPDNGIKRAIALKHFANYYNVVGNVLGDPSVTAAYDIEVNHYNGYGANNVVYQLGYPNAGNTDYSGTIAPTTPPDYTSEGSNIATAQKMDYNVKNTILRHGNHIYATGRNNIEWDPGIADHNIPASLCRDARPAWWPATVPWPPIGPDKTPMVSAIPAQIRFETPPVTPPAAPRNLRKAP